MRRLSVLVGLMGAFVSISIGDPVSGQGNRVCGMQLNQAPVVFCDTFDTARPDSTTRTGDLDENVWGVSRTVGQQNGPNPWPTSKHGGCDQMTTVAPPNDVRICNGRLINVVNDAHNVIVLAMYPKQPFDWNGRTGTVSFDVTNDSQGNHAAWPEFWITDLPIPTPFAHFGSWSANPRNGFGIRFASVAKPGDVGYCDYSPPFDSWRFTVDSAIIIRDYVYEDSAAAGLGSTPSSPPLTVTPITCVKETTKRQSWGDPTGPVNHIEIRIAQNLIEVWASDAGSTTLKHIADISNANLSLSRGLVWLEDAHYNASKGICPQDDGANVGLPACQDDHAFGWDNLAFDGPFVYRDFSYDALDGTAAGPTWPDGSPSTYLGKQATTSVPSTWNIQNLPPNRQAAAVRTLFNTYSNSPPPTSYTITVNGHEHTQAWQYPEANGDSWRTIAITIPITDLVTGTNIVTVKGTDQPITVSNVNIVLVDVPGGVPVLPGSNNAYPGMPSVLTAPTNLRVVP
jgi:hypothetical protein